MDNALLIFIAVYLLLMNIAAFALYGIDKRKARCHKRRISEKTLILAAAFGGSLGAALGMKIFRHKTKKPKFYIGIPAIIILQAGAAAALIFLKHYLQFK